jgi:clan AA aspartic protease (TIGR02281 family)
MLMPDRPAYCRTTALPGARWLAVTAAILSGLLSGCAQLPAPQLAPYDPERQAHVDAVCGSAGSVQGIEQCQQYYIGNPQIPLPREPMHYGNASPAPNYPAPQRYPSAPRPTTEGTTEVALVRQGGTFQVPVVINDAIRLNFVVDSGASEVIIPADVVRTLLRTGTLRDSDLLGEETYVLADGSRHVSRAFRIRSLKVGDKILTDVTGSVAPTEGSLLLGQSFLQRFRSWSIDNARGVLLLN